MKISSINPADLARLVPMRPVQLRLFPEMLLPLSAVARLSERSEPQFSVDIIEESNGTDIVIRGAKKTPSQTR